MWARHCAPRAARRDAGVFDFHDALRGVVEAHEADAVVGQHDIDEHDAPPRAASHLGTPSPASSFMLPERSSTSDTAVRGRAMVLALMLIVQVWPVSTHATVTLPLAVSPGLVDVYESQMRAAAAGTIGIGRHDH